MDDDDRVDDGDVDKEGKSKASVGISRRVGCTKAQKNT